MHVTIQAGLFDTEPRASAVISDCGRFRFRLDRRWDQGSGRVCWVMLNPSTADGYEDDPTLRRCIGFSKAWGYGSLVVVNLFAWRATDPAELERAGLDAVGGPEADSHIEAALQGSQIAVCGWGSGGPGAERSTRIPEVVRLIEAAGLVPMVLGTTRGGDPRHPLYLRSALTPVAWERG